MLEIMSYEDYVELQTNVYDVEIIEIENEEYDKMVKDWIKEEIPHEYEHFFGELNEVELNSYYCTNKSIGTGFPEEGDCEKCTCSCEFRDGIHDRAVDALKEYEYSDGFIDADGNEINLEAEYKLQVTEDKYNINMFKGSK